MNVKQISVMTDFSEQSRVTYAYAKQLGKTLTAQLHLVHFTGVLPWSDDRETTASFEQALDGALAHEAESYFDGMDVRCHLIPGKWNPVALRSLEDEFGIELVIMATHSKSGFERFVFGSFAERVVRNSVAPVFVCRDGHGQSPLAPETVVVPFDFTEASKAVLPMVRLWAKNFGGRYRFLCVHEPPPEHMPFLLSLRERWHAPTRNKLEEKFAALAAAELPGVDVEFELLEGDAADVTTKYCDQVNADLVLIGTHGVLGSVAQNVTRNVTCSVIVSPHPESHRTSRTTS